MEFCGKNIFLIGIGGISMSALAILMHKIGARVSGSDENMSKITQKLENDGINVFYSHGREHITKSIDFVVFSSAISESNEEFLQAKELGIKIFSRAEILGEIAKQYKTVVAVAGSHGKTTTTGMIAHCLTLAGKNPTVHIGGILKKEKTNIIVGGHDYFVTEACEYKNSFLQLKNNSVSCALNVQADHLDFFKTVDYLKLSFHTFLNQTNKSGTKVVNVDDEFLRNESKLGENFLTYGINNQNADIVASNVKENKMSKFEFDVKFFGASLGRIKLPISGFHEIYNALACFGVCVLLGLSPLVIKMGIESFEGIKRRCEEVGHICGALVIHDYAHHPTEIKANIETAKKYTKGKVFVVFQPHTFSRTKVLWSDFAQSLSLADCCILYPIYPAREEPVEGVTSKNLAKEIANSGKCCLHIDNFPDIISYLNKHAVSVDTILILGAGDIDKLCDFVKDKI